MNRQNAISRGICLLLLLSGNLAAHGQEFLVGSLEAAPATTAEEPTAPDDCQPGMLLVPDEYCAYPGTDDQFLVFTGGLAKFLFGTFRDSVNISGRINGREYDLAASHQGSGDWRIDRVAGAGPTEASDGNGSSPSFADACIPEEIWYRAGVVIEPFTFPAATGGDEPLTYYVIDPPGLSLDSATRRLTGTPEWVTHADVAISVYRGEYTVVDADGDEDALPLKIVVMNDWYLPERPPGTVIGNSCDLPTAGSDTPVAVGSDTPGVVGQIKPTRIRRIIRSRLRLGWSHYFVFAGRRRPADATAVG